MQTNTSTRGELSDADIEADCESLIHSLKSPEPATDDRDNLGRPQHVADAMNRLRSYGTKAFPSLITHRGDADYAYSASGFRGTPAFQIVRVRVGGICGTIVKDLVNVVPGTLRYGHYPDTNGYFAAHGMVDWWKKHKGQTLREIRLEVLRWAIQQEKAISTGSPEELRYMERLLALQREVDTNPDYDIGPVY